MLVELYQLWQTASVPSLMVALIIEATQRTYPRDDTKVNESALYLSQREVWTQSGNSNRTRNEKSR